MRELEGIKKQCAFTIEECLTSLQTGDWTPPHYVSAGTGKSWWGKARASRRETWSKCAIRYVEAADVGGDTFPCARPLTELCDAHPSDRSTRGTGTTSGRTAREVRAWLPASDDDTPHNLDTFTDPTWLIDPLIPLAILAMSCTNRPPHIS